MPSFLDNISDITLTPEKLQALKTGMVTKKLPKGHMLLRKGDKASKTYFVKSGCLRSYTIDEKGKEHIFMFAPEGWLIGDIGSFSNDKPSELFIDAIEDSEVEVLDDTLVSMNNVPVQEAVTKLAKRIYVLQKRIIMLMSATLQERYLDFIETYPDIVQRVPQKMIASYLGVTPEALSKMRGELLKK
jgi:CRP-like cAMP-binding protein